jgi:hypothetical protein
MELLRWKARLAVLWVLLAAGFAMGMALTLAAPGMIKDVMAGQIMGMTISEGTLVIWALLFLIPGVMAILCLTLYDSLNRWLSFILGIVLGLFYVFDLVNHAARGYASVSGTLMLIAAIVIAAIIAWLTWIWPKQQA